MKLFQRIFFAAVLAGLAGGAGMAALQQWRVVPLILQAEVHEKASAHDAGTHTHEHEETAWAPADGAERIAFTAAATIQSALGFAFILAAVSVLSGMEVTARNGVIWGLAGFAVFQLAPAFGLPPELPGMSAADLAARQVWWWGAALVTATAIFGVARFQNFPAVASGALLILLPHLIGVPRAVSEQASSIPPQLATAFAANTLVVGAAFWMVLGPLYGYLVEGFARSAPGTAAAA